jgi:hypothetical protein
MNRYEDILHLPHHVSTVHPQMARADRAAQFAPFAALTGHGAAIRETARLTDAQEELDEDVRLVLDEKLQYLLEHLAGRPVITVTFFRTDEKKAGGSYESVTGIIRRIDLTARKILMEDGSGISLDAVTDIDSELFDDIQM